MDLTLRTLRVGSAELVKILDISIYSEDDTPDSYAGISQADNEVELEKIKIYLNIYIHKQMF